MTAAYVSPTNYIPSFDATGNLIVAYSRNQKDFPLNEYITLRKVDKWAGFYIRITPDQAGRIRDVTDNKQFLWPDGQKAPLGEASWNGMKFEYQPYLVERWMYPYSVGYEAERQADWDVILAHTQMLGQQAMTWRTAKAVTTATTAGNFPAAHVATATSWGGGQWGSGTLTARYIQAGLAAIGRQIAKSTYGAISPQKRLGKFNLVVNPTLADTMARSQEISVFVAQQTSAPGIIQWDTEFTAIYGLPKRLYGYNVVVEDTVNTTSIANTDDTSTPGFVLGDTTAFVAARPGELVSPAGGPNFSTLHLFNQEEMTAETFDDVNNRMHNIRVVDAFDLRAAAPLTGAIITSAA